MSFRKDQLKVDEPFDFEGQELFNVNQIRLNRVQQSELKADSIAIDDTGAIVLKQGTNPVKILIDSQGKISQDVFPETLNISINQKEMRIAFSALHLASVSIDVSVLVSGTYQISGDVTDFSFGNNLFQFNYNKNIQIYRSGLLMDKYNDLEYLNNTNIRFLQDITPGEIVIIRW